MNNTYLLPRYLFYVDDSVYYYIAKSACAIALYYMIIFNIM